MAERKNSRQWGIRHEFFEETAAKVEAVLKDFNIDADVAEQCGSAIADMLAKDWGGQILTIPMDYHFQLSKRDMEIWDAFNGTNHSELAKRYNVSVNAIYRILARTRGKATARVQSQLFDDDKF